LWSSTLLLALGVARIDLAADTADPWALPSPPPPAVYTGPLFAMSHDYPLPPPAAPSEAPWRAAIGNDLISVDNAAAYVQALKDHIAGDMRVLLFDYADWDAAQAGWYNAPWLTGVREPIHGTYVGSSFPAEMFPRSGLSEPMTTHVLVYYDAVASAVLSGIWGDSGLRPLPGIESGKGQYPEGSIVVKPAFTTADGANWPPMQGAYTWPIYAKPGAGTGGEPELQSAQLFQFDIIVKDSASAPETQWVFTTLVYDKDAPGDMWDKLVPLGAMWGADPDVASPQGCDPIAGTCPPLSQTWINPDAPLYAKETLGWGGRLSGPNDGAVDIDAAEIDADGSIKPYKGRYAMSSCMSCHNAAEYALESFLLPSPAQCEGDSCSPTLVTCKGDSCEQSAKGDRIAYHRTGSKDFMRWFVNRPGNEPMDPGTISLDYGMNNAFKSVPTWYATTHGKKLRFAEPLTNYQGHTLRFR
jgi:hypothetical protein